MLQIAAGLRCIDCSSDCRELWWENEGGGGGMLLAFGVQRYAGHSHSCIHTQRVVKSVLPHPLPLSRQAGHALMHH